MEQQTYLRLEHRGRTQNMGGAIAGDSWSRNSTRTDYTFEDLYIVKKDDCFTDVVPYSVTDGQTLFAVVAVYETGDSFGRDTAQPYHMATFKTRQEAEEFVNTILNSHNKKEREWPFSVELELHGQKATIQIPWAGYFEKLEELEIYPMTLKRWY